MSDERLGQIEGGVKHLVEASRLIIRAVRALADSVEGLESRVRELEGKQS